MTRNSYRIYDNAYPHFMTRTIVGWIAVFTRRETVELIYDSWRFLQRERGFQLFGYVILENHLHLIAKADELSDVMQSFKSYTAKRFIELLEQRHAGTMLKQLSAHKLKHKTESKYQVWQEGNHPEQIQGDDMMWQKLEYTHNNPVVRGYVDDPLHWRNSSARNYAGQQGLIDVCTNWR